MTDKRDIATAILAVAQGIIGSQRKNQHGDAENSFRMIADLWSAYLSTAHGNENVLVTIVDVAHMMTLLKIARSMHGDPRHTDHYVDAAGYSALAGMLAGAGDPSKGKETPSDDPVGDFQAGKGHAPKPKWLVEQEANDRLNAKIKERIGDLEREPPLLTPEQRAQLEKYGYLLMKPPL